MTPLAGHLPADGLLAAFALMLRISAFVAVAPIVGSIAIPVRARVAFAVVLVVLLAPVAPAPRAGTGAVPLVAGELLIGLLLGTAARAIVEAATYAGGLAGYPAGLAIAAVLDPVTQEQMPTLSIFYRLLALVAYLALGGHREFLAVLARSYEIVPVGAASLGHSWLPGAVALTSRVLVLGLRVAAPILVAGLLVDLCLMLIARAVPQMHILIVGAPIRLLVGLVAVAFSLHALMPVIGEAITAARHDGVSLLRVLAP